MGGMGECGFDRARYDTIKAQADAIGGVPLFLKNGIADVNAYIVYLQFAVANSNFDEFNKWILQEMLALYAADMVSAFMQASIMDGRVIDCQAHLADALTNQQNEPYLSRADVALATALTRQQAVEILIFGFWNGVVFIENALATGVQPVP